MILNFVTHFSLTIHSYTSCTRFINQKCYNGYSINGYVFYIEEYGLNKKTYNYGVFFVKGSTSNEFEVDFYGKLEEVIEL